MLPRSWRSIGMASDMLILSMNPMDEARIAAIKTQGACAPGQKVFSCRR